ncbi:DUF5018 domain-containing protein [Ichthyobacterium seriolicida]|uniref:Pkd domain containing protein n=1 Tax=Ichthyobacterium seriolicida TaxID=242600 RepID=A0A1J1DXP1_9FLAO|nr:hypothetical protein [Ichthyobacterium seriolicida]BAV94631.1 pkd domain containing protein [Ichthyobacterium seriolicida]
MKKNYFVKSIIFSFVLLSVIIFSCDKKNIIEDDLNVCIKSFELLNSENEGKNLGSNIDCEIDAENYTISLTVPHTAVLDGLKFNITPCEGTTISPASGEEINFEEVVEESIEEQATTEGADEKTTKKPSPQRYKKVFTVIKDGKSQDYTVYITKALASDCSISSFKLEKSKNETKIFGDREGQITEADEANTITLHISDAATLDGLTPTIVYTGTSFSSESPVSTTENSITTTTVNYTVTAADEKTTKVYKVIYIKDLSSNNKISVFSFTKDTTNNTGLKLTRSSADTARPGDVVISNNSTNTGTETISVKVSTAATITALTPTITKHENAIISPAIESYNYGNNATKVYTVTAQDGQAKQYTVSVAKDLSNNKNMTSFKFEYTQNTDKSFNSQDYDGTINNPSSEEDGTVTIAKMPHTITNLTGLKPSIVLSNSNATVSPGNGIAQDFTRGEEKIYTVTAQDGTTRKYKVTIGELSAAADITSFIIKKSDHTTPNEVRMTGSEVSGVISNSGSNHTITISLDGEGDTSVNLKPEIIVSPGATVSPTSGAGTEFTYGTAQTYTVIAENGTQTTYRVTVKSSNSKLESFNFKSTTGNNQSTGKIVQEVEGTINDTDKTVKVNVPYDAVLNGLTPDIEVYNGASVTAPSGGANTAQDFSSGSVTYTVTAQDGKSTTEYTVTVTQNAAPQIESFKFMTASNNSKNLGGDITGTITHNSGTTAGEIIVKVPHDADLNGLVPTVTGASNVTVYKGGADSTAAANSSDDFSNSHTSPVQYSAVGPAGGRKVYSVKVYKEPAITEFKFTNTDNTEVSFPSGTTEYIASPITQGDFLGSGTIAITVANTVDVTKLKKASITGDNIAANLVISDLNFISGSVTVVTVANEHLPSYTKNYNVTVTNEAAPQLTSFTITANSTNGITADVQATTITHPNGSNTGTIKLKFPKNNANEFNLAGLSYTSNPPTSSGGYTLTPSSPLDSSSIHEKEFTLTTALGSTSKYTVTAVKGPYISSFKFENSQNSEKSLGSDVVGTIDHAASTIQLLVSSGVTMDSDGKVTLKPTIELGGDTAVATSNAINSGTEYSFTPDGSTAVEYTVKNSSDANFTKTYNVTVTKGS